MITESLSGMSQERFDEIKDNWLSVYPILYYKLRHFKNIDFNFNNDKVKRINRAFSKPIEFEDMLGAFNAEFKSIEYKDLTDEFLIEFSKTFFSLDYFSRERLFKVRNHYLVDTYNKKERDIEEVSWCHDGWWNCYHGNIVDENGKDIILKKYNEYIDNKEVLDFYFIRVSLVLMHRYIEIGNVDEAVTVGKYLQKRLYKIIKDQAERDGECFNYTTYLRYNINVEMVLYRAEKNLRKKIRIMKRIDRRNNIKNVFLVFNFLRFNTLKRSVEIPTVGSRDRPQHITKLIEFKGELYKYTKNKKEREKIKEEIKQLIMSFIITLRMGYYEPTTLVNLFSIQEFYFAIFICLENIYNINIQEY